MNGTNDQPLPTRSELIRATAIALVVSIVLLVTAILPAEYGLDPVGVGRVLGLDKLGLPSANAEELVPDVKGMPFAGTALSRADTTLKRNTLTVVVPAYEGVELKAEMKAGQSLVFDWRTDGEALYSDMHGEPPDAAGNAFTSYWKENAQNAGRGTLVARFEGTHGWYWQNMSDHAVTVTVDVSGFYQDIFEKD